ncbi:MAG: DNA-cytosine methyltransferase (EC [uncultured Thiotrichaceae bacterium]|uniref:Cytosine-specific methyltransferase n=1 Tax=uncultured Thiotrichaceae bacterium TaxID=298394 RepID=A0A6S6S5Y2_9GAMM|nr:MAG: DNA-cytosine methyltransferase (EC [uncultured Thiotrichaceae bacterium]
MYELSPKDLLKQARNVYTQKEIADYIGRDVRTVKRWEVNEGGPPKYAAHGLQQLVIPLSSESSSHSDFTFIDLFAGIGGIRMGFESVGGKCVFTSEWNKYAVKTYSENFPMDHPVQGDITEIHENDVPDHDLLLAGFPCQPFSIAGVSKKNSMGRSHGFDCDTQGTLFFDIERIIREKQPKAFLLENVKNLKSHDKGNTFRVIKRTLEDDLGYEVYPMVIDAKGFVPQHRERIYIVGFRKDVGFSWDLFKKPDVSATSMADILHPEDGTEVFDDGSQWIQTDGGLVNPKYTLSDKLWTYLFDYAAKHKAKGNGFGYGMVKPDDTARTLSARYYKDGSEILVYQGEDKNPRRLTPRECARLMGYPDSFKIPVSDTQAYKQFGNSVAVPVIREVARIMKPYIIASKEEDVEDRQYRLFG